MSSSSNDILHQAVRDFKRSVEITRDVRFQANLRLSRRQRASSYIVSLLSLYVIALSLLPNILDLKPFQNQILLACSIVLSVFVIFTSLIDGAQNFYHQGELLHQCARKIATVHHDLKNIDIDASPAFAAEEFARLQKEYAKALDECPINHENVDFYAEQARKPNLFPMEYTGYWTPFLRSWFRFKAWSLSSAWCVPHILAVIIVSGIVFEFIFRSAIPFGTAITH